MLDTITNLPKPFIDRLVELFTLEQLTQVSEAFTSPKPSTFRINTLKATEENVVERLHILGIEVEKVDWLPQAFILKNVPQKILTETDIYKEGLIYVQSLSSMLPALVLDVQPTDTVLDLCAAPGSKTTQMAALMNNQGKILANDKSRIRLYKLAANLKLQGVTNAEVSSLIGQLLWRKYPEYFDKTLVDVPCSMEGRFYTGYEKSYQDWALKKVKILSQIQRFLLRAAVSATKVGGSIVYSTCTLSPEENEEVIDWILKREAGVVEVETIDFKIPEKVSGMTSWQNRTYDLTLTKTLRILPSKLLEGFYIAKLKKVRSNT